MIKQPTSHANHASLFNQDVERVNWHDKTLWWVRHKRDHAARQLPDWEALRETASQIKNNVLSNLSEYLIQFEERAVANGIEVHWAADAAEHNQIVLSLLKQQGITRMVKSKSMLTEECQLNEYLQTHGLKRPE